MSENVKLFSDIYDALTFLTRKMGVPNVIVMHAADEARKVIHKYILETSNERRSTTENSRIS